MNVLRWTVVSAAALLVSAPAAATDWIMLSDLVTLTRIDFVDRDSLRVRDGQAEALLYAVFIDDRPSGMAAMEVRYLFDCAQPRGRALHGRTFNARQEVRSEGAMDEDWQEIAPSNFLAVIRPFACSNGAEPAGRSMGSAHPFVAARQALRESRDRNR